MMLRVKVTPRASKNEIVGTMDDGTLKVKIAAPPEKGKANEALCAFLAAHYGVAKSAVRVVSGYTSTMKRVEVEV